MQSTFQFNNEDEVKCRLTGFKGVVIARTEWNNGCRRYTVQPKVGADGKLPDPQVFDEQDLVLVKGGAKSAASTPKPFTGGPPRREPLKATGH